MELSKEQRAQAKAEKRAAKMAARGEYPDQSPVTVSVNPNDTITVLCVRFGNKYGREYVERLRNMVARHLTVPYDFACLTDDSHPIPGVRTIFQSNANYARGWWHKVHMFDPSLSLSGRILYFDLDVVIHSNINKLVSYHPQNFIGIHDFNRKFFASWNYLNSSVLAWNHGSQSHIYQQFKKDPGTAQRMQGDQDWIWKLCKDRIKFWPKEWIMSYKWEIRSRDELIVAQSRRQFKTVRDDIQPPLDCSIAVFHGEPNPQDVQDKFVVDNWR
jgi:hypothetical protein